MIQQLIRWTILGAGGALLASCATYPYDTAFNSCEAEANQCYRLCEDIPGENGYLACQRHCDADIDRCFNSAYNSYNSTYYGYGYGSPSIWYGRYGAWYPDYGYYLSFNFYDRYGYRRNRGYPWGAGRYNYSPRRYHGNRGRHHGGNHDRRHDGDRDRNHDRHRDDDGHRRNNDQGSPTPPRTGDYRSRPRNRSGSPTYNRGPRSGPGNRGPQVLPPQSAPRTPPPPRASSPAPRSAPPPPRRSAPPRSTSDDNSSSRSRGDGPRRRNRD